MKNILNKYRRATAFCFVALLACFVISCESLYDYDLPEANSQVDTALPNANFGYAASVDDFKTIKFNNLSSEATTFSWDFGGGATSSAEDPTYTFAAEGEYPVTLTASDDAGASKSVTLQVLVAPGPFQPVLLEAGFEDNSLPDGSGDGRDSWRTNSYAPSNWATIHGISSGSSNVKSGNQAAKLELNSPRTGYQEFAVEKNSPYDIGFWYKITAGSSDPWATVAIVGVTENGPITSEQQARDGVIASITVNEEVSPADYIEAGFSFNSGENELVALYFYNAGGSEVRLDDFTIDIGVAGAIPPSPGFDFVQSEVDFLEYSFSDASVDAVSWEWDFGDGNTSTDQNPTHTYDTPNTYDVTLTVKNEAGLEAELTKSIDIQAPVTSAFTATVDPADYQSYSFTDESEGAVMLLWEFGDGFQFTGMDPSHTYAEDGTYTVTLTAYSVTGAMDVSSETLNVTQGEVVTLINGDFEANSTGWKISSFPGGNTNPFNSSSDGAFMDYFGNVTASKTRGAKWTMSTSDAEWRSSSSRYAYQAIDLTPGNEYTFEFSYAMKNDAATDPVGGRRMIGEILTGHYTDGTVARAASDAGALVQLVGTMANGKTSHEVLKADFIAPASGEVSIWLYAVTPVDGYMDNVKIYVKE